MLAICTTLYVLVSTSKDRLRERLGPRERGSVSLEQVVVTLGLFLVAGAIVAGITAVATGKLDLIK